MRLSGGLSQSPTTTSTSASRRIFLALLTTTSLVNGTWAAGSRNKTNVGKQLQTPADMNYYVSRWRSSDGTRVECSCLVFARLQNALDDTFLIPPCMRLFSFIQGSFSLIFTCFSACWMLDVE